jgi:hypothetical protein
MKRGALPSWRHCGGMKSPIPGSTGLVVVEKRDERWPIDDPHFDAEERKTYSTWEMCLIVSHVKKMIAAVPRRTLRKCSPGDEESGRT